MTAWTTTMATLATPVTLMTLATLATAAWLHACHVLESAGVALDRHLGPVSVCMSGGQGRSEGRRRVGAQQAACSVSGQPLWLSKSYWMCTNCGQHVKMKWIFIQQLAYTHTHTNTLPHAGKQSTAFIGSGQCALKMSRAFRLMMDYGCAIVPLLAQVLFASSLQLVPGLIRAAISSHESLGFGCLGALGTYCSKLRVAHNAGTVHSNAIAGHNDRMRQSELQTCNESETVASSLQHMQKHMHLLTMKWGKNCSRCTVHRQRPGDGWTHCSLEGKHMRRVLFEHELRGYGVCFWESCG